jgi:hypothetical protein
MQPQYPTAPTDVQASPDMAQHLASQLEAFLQPLLLWLDTTLDKRLVRTFLHTVQAILQFRHRAHGLLLSELGAYLLSPAQAPAGTKRLSNLLHSPKWAASLIEQFLWDQAGTRLTALEEAGGDALVVWDESVLEKPESLAAEGLCAVRSTKAARLKRIKPGYFNPPGGRPICVPGLHWLSLLLLGGKGPPTLALMRWWTTRGLFATDRRSQEQAVLQQCAAAWGQRVLHVFDRGFAGSPWLGQLVAQQTRWLLRWPKAYHLVDAQGRERPAWQIARGKKTWERGQVWDGRRHRWRVVGLLALPVHHPAYDTPLWLVVSRPGKGQTPWYLLTNEPLQTAADAWRLIRAYGRRWQIEQTWRYSKSELACESPRLWLWETRRKLLLLASLAYAFLLSLLDEAAAPVRAWLLRCWCHRTGKRSRETSTPLYRLRAALSRLWLAYRPVLPNWLLQNSG